MSSAKTLNQYGLLAKLEATYATAIALSAATDGLLVDSIPEPSIAYAFDGQREGTNTVSAAKPYLLAPAGRMSTLSLLHSIKGAGAAYSASVLPSPDRLLRAHGMGATVVVTAGSETVTYAPVSSGFGSLTLEAYTRGQKWAMRGAYVNKLVIESKGYGVPKMTADLSAISSLPVDAAVPAITYAGSSVKPPKASNVGLTLTAGGQTFIAKVREFTITSERELVTRADSNEANGDIAGFGLGARTVTVDCLMEATALPNTPFISGAAFDPYKLYDLGTAFAFALAIGGTQYNKFSAAAPNAQFVGVPSPERDGPVALWQCSFQVTPANENSEVDISLLFN